MNRWLPAVLIAVASCGGGSSDSSPGSGGSGGAGGSGASGGAGADGGGSGGSGGTAGDAGGPGDMTPDGVCTYYADRFCETDQKCTYDFEAYWNDMAICKERTKIGCISRLTASGVNDTPSRVVACADAWANLSCESYVDYDHRPEFCRPPPGQLADGAPCIVAGQCQGGACDIASRVACGACKTIGRIGDACMTENDCLDFMPCVNGICTAHPKGGEPCNGADRVCVLGWACKNVDATGLGTCSLPTPPGGACDPNFPGGDVCDLLHSYACDVFSSTCKPIVPTPKIGASCVEFGYCSSVAFCNVNGICQANPREGEPCGSGSCMTPARCIDNVCKIRDPAVCK